jgi:hypothetical protein
MSTDIARINLNAEMQSAGFFSTVDASTDEGKKTVYTAINSAESLRDLVGKTVHVVDFIVQEVEVVSDETDETISVPRSVIVLDDGSVYAATSNGVFNSIRNILSIFGSPRTWGAPLTVKVDEKSTRRNNMFRYLTLSVV